jgi:hypothetical protein
MGWLARGATGGGSSISISISISSLNLSFPLGVSVCVSLGCVAWWEGAMGGVEGSRSSRLVSSSRSMSLSEHKDGVAVSVVELGGHVRWGMWMRDGR